VKGRASKLAELLETKDGIVPRTKGPGRLSPRKSAFWAKPEPLYPVLAPAIDLVARLVLDLRIVHGERLPRSGPVLMVANHVSFLDPPALFVTGYRLGRRVRFVALSTLFEVPVVGWLLRLGRMIAVSRGGGAQAMVTEAREAWAAGQALLVYPEGTIPPSGASAGGRPGACLLALSASAPVIPMASLGLERGLPKWRLRRPAVVVIGEPVDLASWRGRVDRRAQLEASAALLDAVRALLPEAMEHLVR
jgi:1-acyl-sn-glycerol-3-phosphate acyltransferase